MANDAIWVIAALSALGVIARPWKLPEAVWAVSGAAVLIVLGLIPWRDAMSAVGKGSDVYLFLTGMMLLAELARKEGLFDFLAGGAVRMARGSAVRFFGLVYAVGTAVTVLMSNDATAVVLTPAVFAAAKAAKVKNPLPYLLICAFIANAASFVLPISNPANLVIFREQMPALLQWFRRFAIPSIFSIAVTFAALWLTQRDSLRERIGIETESCELSSGGLATACGIAATATVLLLCSALGLDLGLPTFLAGAATALAVLILTRQNPSPALKDISWEILPLVAGLFVLVEALARTGVPEALIGFVQAAANRSATAALWGTGTAVAVVCNLVNNLPAGLMAGAAISGSKAPRQVVDAVLIGVDLGPNLSVTGSLATILWLTALRRENQHMSAWSFLKLGIVIMPPALIVAIAGLLVNARL